LPDKDIQRETGMPIEGNLGLDRVSIQPLTSLNQTDRSVCPLRPSAGQLFKPDKYKTREHNLPCFNRVLGETCGDCFL
jgi:hypothetical protein